MKNKHKLHLVILPLILSIIFLTHCTEEPFEPTITGSLEGQVLDAETNDPISNVTISTQPSTDVVLTDSAGRYKIAEVDTGRYSVMAEKNDYQSKMLGILIKENKTSQVNFLLTQKDKKKDGNIRFSNNFKPNNGAEDQPPNITLAWNAYQENSDDSLSYDVKMFNGRSMKEYLDVKNLKDTFLTVNSLPFNQIFYWQVIARNNEGDTANSKMLNFHTKNISDNSFLFVRKIEQNYEIMAYEMESEAAIRITDNSYMDWAPKRNSKSGRIAFVNDSKVKSYLYSMGKDCAEVTQVTDIAVTGYHNDGNAFAWDEKNGKFLFSHYQHLYEINEDGTNLRTIATAPDGRHFREIDISPDNSKIVALTIGEKIFNSEIRLMDRDGSNQEILIGSMDGIVESPSFSIDGNSILFTHDVSGNQALDGRMLDSRIFSLNLENRDTTDLSTNKPIGTNDINPTYSPTGHKIIFSNVVNDNSESPSIWMMDVDGTNREKLIDNGELPNWN